jgi:Ser/Thr protein kinase RdoA (MazF antagonist)
MQTLKVDTNLLKAIEAFGFDSASAEVSSISNGLINSTYKISEKEKAIVLQKLNSSVFKNPGDIVHNYAKIYDHLKTGHEYGIPAPVKTIDRNNFFTDPEMNCWRATEFFPATYTPETPNEAREAFEAALCFGNFTRALSALHVEDLKVIIPQFHDLELKYKQFIESLEKSSAERKEKANHEIDQLQNKKKLVDFYTNLKTDHHYKLRVMHHDAKLSNILFDNKNGKVVCPVDLDTTQPGYFFSDIGDMIRSMACTLSENSIDFFFINIRPDFYKAIIDGYMAAMKDEFTETEKKNIHYAGLLMIYMQALRYLADYLNGDIYYRITYPEQNFDRAKNQLILLQRLEEFLNKEFNF